MTNPYAVPSSSARAWGIKESMDGIYSDRTINVAEVRTLLKDIQTHVNMLLEALVQTDEERDI